SAQFEGCFDLDRDAARQRRRADRGAGVLSGVAEYLDHQVGGAVDDLRHIGEVGCAIDKAANPQATAYAVKIAAGGDAEMRDEVQRAETRGLLAVGDADAGAELPDKAPFAVPLADLPGDEDLIAGEGERHVIGQGRRRLRQFDAKLTEPRFDLSAHRPPL